MGKIKYYYDNESCCYKKINMPKKKILLKYTKSLIFCLTCSFFIVFVKNSYCGSDKKKSLLIQNENLKYKYNLLCKDLYNFEKKLQEHENQDNLCRDVLNASYLPESMRKAGKGGVNRYKSLEFLDKNKVILKTVVKIDNIKDKINIQFKSYEEILKLDSQRTHLFLCTPCISPLNKTDIKRISGTFGHRKKHPVLGIPRMHNGHDFVASHNKPVYATAKGIVLKSRYSASAGNYITIKHGYGKKTRYFHLSTRLVKVGDKVNRGDIIGLSGSTGTSSGPHVHYEILDNEKHVDPRNYLFDNKINQKQYDEIKKINMKKN